jgi:hypothetical protein
MTVCMVIPLLTTPNRYRTLNVCLYTVYMYHVWFWPTLYAEDMRRLQGNAAAHVDTPKIATA